MTETVDKYGEFSILITDDDHGARDVLSDIVQAEGFRTVLASSGEEAIDIVQDRPVHLALFDLHMPKLTGLETIEIVHQYNAVLPCILVTADADEGVIRQAFQQQVCSVIPKPVSKNMVLTVVTRTIIRVYGEEPGASADQSNKSA